MVPLRCSRHRTRGNVRHEATAKLALVLVALLSSVAPAHETDQYTLPVGRDFADLGPHLTRVVHGAIVDAVSDTNAAIKRSLREEPTIRDSRRTDATSPLQSADYIAGKVWLQLFAAFPMNETLDNGLVGMHARYPGLITAYRPEQSIYDDPVLVLDVTKLVRLFFRADTVNADGKLFGTDKIIHFLHLGRIYHSSYLSARAQGLNEAQAMSRAVQVSAGNNPFLSENWLLGTLSTGIRSNGDLAANYAGLKFYRNLTEEVRIGNRVMPPMLVREGPYWRLNSQVRPDTDFFTAFITPHWNEALNPSVYAIVTRGRVRAMLRSRCPDLLDWYRDERGRPLNRQQFAEIERELATFYGEEYGYENDGKDAVSIATTCFPSAQPDSAGVVSAYGGIFADPEVLDLHRQNVFGLQSGWGRYARTEAFWPVRSQASLADPFGRSELWWAAKDGRLEDVERLLAQGENPNTADIDGEAPLHAAARWGQVAVVELLLSQGADPSARALYGMTPLHVSVLAGQIAATRVLLNHNADVNTRDMFGKSPLQDAALRGNSELAALLLAHGADPSIADDSGTTALHVAAHAGNEPLVELLLAHGADPRMQNWAGSSPYDEAKRRDHKAILRQLVNANPEQHESAIIGSGAHATSASGR